MMIDPAEARPAAAIGFRTVKTVLSALLLLGALGIAPPAMAQQAPPAGRGAMKACMPDRKALCPNMEPGGGRILACLQQNADKLSPACHQALTAAKAARQTPGSGS